MGRGGVKKRKFYSRVHNILNNFNVITKVAFRFLSSYVSYAWKSQYRWKTEALFGCTYKSLYIP